MYATDTDHLTIDILGKQWTLERRADLESLWREIDQESLGEDDRLPYWTEAWPAGLGLAQWLLENPAAVRGKCCLDLGCGLGLAAMAAAQAGGRVTGADYEPQALQFARRNAARNNAPVAGWLAMDWRAPACRRGAFECILAADVVYERRFIEPVSGFLEHALAPGGEVYIAEPCRNFWTEYLGRARSRGWSAERVSRQEARPAAAPSRKVLVEIWRFTPPS